MNIVFQDHQGNVLLRLLEFNGTIDPQPNNIINGIDILDCLFREDEIWIQDELCALAEERLNLLPNNQYRVNDERDEFEISQDNGLSVFVYVENALGEKITIDNEEEGN
jgi:hypothetical protein